jgi:hypothetical protein
MGLINWIFDFYQQYRIDELRKETAQAQAAMRTPGGGVDVDRLERTFGELALAVKTMQRMMVEKGVCTPEEFHGKLRAIDLEDGREDGRAPV